MKCINQSCERNATRLMKSIARNEINYYCGICCRSFCDYIEWQYENDIEHPPVIEVNSIEEFVEVGYRYDLPLICFYRLKKGEVIE